MKATLSDSHAEPSLPDPHILPPRPPPAAVFLSNHISVSYPERYRGQIYGVNRSGYLTSYYLIPLSLLCTSTVTNNTPKNMSGSQMTKACVNEQLASFRKKFFFSRSYRVRYISSDWSSVVTVHPAVSPSHPLTSYPHLSLSHLFSNPNPSSMPC